MEKYISTGELARRLSVCRETINNWIKIGRIKPSLVIQKRNFFTEQNVVEIENNYASKTKDNSNE